jgi:hypothetical protein
VERGGFAPLPVIEAVGAFLVRTRHWRKG